MEKICKTCGTAFTITEDDLSFYSKIDVPPPTLCPECRYVRRLLDRNEYNFYKRRCDAPGHSEEVISIYRADQPFPVYDQAYWKSDAWDAARYGRDFDFGRPFFEQYEELRRTVPHLALVNSASENSEYTNQSEHNKDCYMLVTSNTSEKCMYGSWNQNQCFWCADCYMIDGCELCYECMNLKNCSNCAWLYNAADCVNVYFSSYCRGCTDCFGCIGLRGKRYYWFNQPLSRAEYESRLKDFAWTREAISKAKAQHRKAQLRMPVKYYHGSQNDGSSGDYLENTQRARLSFNCREVKDAAYMQDAWTETVDCRDCTEIIVGERSYEIQGVERPHRTIVARSCFNAITDSCYCDMCFGVQDCFGCFGLRQKQYCILNKQYSREEYPALKAKIIEHMQRTGEWGEYFPPEASPFAYNESMAQDYFPLEREEALRQGYVWHDKPAPDYSISLTPDRLPATAADITDNIVNEVIRCRTQEAEEARQLNPLCTTAFRLVPLELALYKKLGVPVPEYCFPCRRRERFGMRNPRRLWERTCQCRGLESENTIYQNRATHFHGGSTCSNRFETTYAPDRPETVYCEACYNAEIV